MNETVESLIQERKIKFRVLSVLVTIIILVNMWGWSFGWASLAEDPTLWWPKAFVPAHGIMVVWMTVRLVQATRWHYETLEMVNMILKAKDSVDNLEKES